MELTKRNFTVLYEYLKNPYASQREVAERTGLSLGSVNAANRELTNEGLLESDSLTDNGYEALHPYKVENAVILAAGLSSRFAPISYEKPKGLLKVRGEILIERQIRQLQDAGISNITVVVGYKKEYFFYLESKFGVSIVVNNEYASKNNHASLMCVKERLGNTYICSSDDYLLNNPFEAYVWKAFYSAQYAEGATKEWCIQTGAMDKITNVTIGGSDAWYMLGHVYFDKAFSLAFKQILETEYNKPETSDKLWEDLYIEHIKELDMVIKKYPEGEINEFDSLDELRAFDPHFIENVDSDIFDNIEQVLGCSKSEIHDVYPLKQGLTNLSCHFRTNDGEYVYRHPGVGTELLINRNGEVAALKKAKELGLDDTFIHEDPKRGWKISKFVPNAKQPDPHDAAQMNRMMQMCRSLHESGANVETEFDFYLEAKRYESLLLEKGPIDIPGYREMSAEIDELERFVQADNAPKCLCHNDFFYLNFLIDENDKYYLIDWEYAGMSDYANDFGTCSVCCELSEDEVDRALDAYFGRKATNNEVAHNYAHIALAGWCWYLWSLLKEAEGDFVGEWLYIYFNYGAKYLKRHWRSIGKVSNDAIRLFSGLLWGLDTVILGIGLALAPYIGSAEALACASIAGSFLHDAFCAIWLFGYMGVRGRLKDTLASLKTRSGKVVIAGALLGGPIGMTGYVLAINNIGAAYTAIISAFYPAVGAFLSFVLLKEKMGKGQILSLLVALCGVMTMGYLSAGSSEIANAPLGLLGAVLAVIGWGSEAVLCAWGMKDDAVDDETALQIRETTSALVYGVLVLPLFGAWHFTLGAIPSMPTLIIALAGLAGTASYLFYYKGIAAIGAARAMALNISYSAWSVVFGLILLGTIPDMASVICCIVIVCGTVLAASNWDELFGRNKTA